MLSGVLPWCPPSYHSIRPRSAELVSTIYARLNKSIGNGTSGQHYDELKAGLDRLVGTRYKTNISTGNTVITENFSMLESYTLVSKILKRGRRRERLDKVRVTVSGWFYRAIESKEVLSIPATYFEVRGGLERRLYELVRKHCGNQASWAIGLDRLYLKSGSTGTERKFRFKVRNMVGKDCMRLLDYFVAVDGDNLYAFSDTDEGKKALAKRIAIQARRQSDADSKACGVPDTTTEHPVGT